MDALLPIKDIARKIDLTDENLIYYGQHMAKIKLDLLRDEKHPPSGKLIMVTAVTPTSHGEGKTVVSIGLAQAMSRCGRKALLTLREPSLGPVFGLKGGATGGGRAQVLPAARINLHFTGDFHAITSAHNLLAAAIDSHIHHGNQLGIDVDNIFWPRAMDMNDRALRHIIVGLGGKNNGVPRETGFVITAASEIMAILGLARSMQDLRHRLEEIVIGFNREGKIIRACDLKVTGAMMVLLREAIMPNLVQTTEHTPALVHTGPFANIAHGTSSVISQLMAVRLADYVINESGFGADLGAEKYFNLAMHSSGLKPSVAVLIATVKAMEAHGADPASEGLEPLHRGLDNLAKHLDNLRKFKVPVVIAINRFKSDTAEEIAVIEEFCRRAEVDCAVVDVYERGGEGAIELAEKVMAVADRSHPDQVHSLYPLDLSLEEKVSIVAREIYGASSVYFDSNARKLLRKFTDLGYGNLPVCMAKTPASLSDNPKLLNVPKDWTLTVSDARLSAGAGFVVVVAGSMMLMPGLPKVPQAVGMDVDDDGNIIGMSY
ncbi:MAG: formate--tetrahydrofolate ligase [Acidobacteriota bacterium]|nr:MAG: formate--tetrahydrofolate ligase [Acidobacteriota bacterium]